jgi:hypothetical protein
MAAAVQEVEQHGTQELQRFSEPAAVAPFSWDFPLSRQEKMHRVLLLFEGEVDRGERELSSLRRENKKLRSAVQSLAAVTMSPRGTAPSRQEQPAGPSSTEQDEIHCQDDQTSRETQSVSEAQRMASFIDLTSRSVVEETYSFFDQTSKKVVEDTEEVKEALRTLHEKSTSAVDAEAQRMASFIDHTSRSVVEETYSFFDHTSKKVAEDTEEVNEFLKALQEKSATVVDAALSDVDSYVDAVSESAKIFALKRNNVLQAFGDWRTESTGLATVAQSQLEEFGGKAHEQAQAIGASLGQAFEVGFGWWGQEPLKANGRKGGREPSQGS